MTPKRIAAAIHNFERDSWNGNCKTLTGTHKPGSRGDCYEPSNSAGTKANDGPFFFSTIILVEFNKKLEERALLNALIADPEHPSKTSDAGGDVGGQTSLCSSQVSAKR